MKYNYKELYNKSYEKFTPSFMEERGEELRAMSLENSDSLIKFFNSYLQQFESHRIPENTKILELGAGLGGLSLYLTKHGFKAHSLDFSPLALQVIQTLFKNANESANIIHADVTKENLELEGRYDFIIDSHLLHCIPDQKERLHYFNFVKKHLKKDGIFLLETMCYQRNLKFPIGYLFDENYTLFQEIAHEFIPTRKIYPSIEIEEELKSAGFEIHYLYYHSELSFNLFNEYKDYAHDSLPKTLRIGASLSNKNF